MTAPSCVQSCAPSGRSGVSHEQCHPARRPPPLALRPGDTYDDPVTDAVQSVDLDPVSPGALAYRITKLLHRCPELTQLAASTVEGWEFMAQDRGWLPVG